MVQSKQSCALLESDQKRITDDITCLRFSLRMHFRLHWHFLPIARFTRSLSLPETAAAESLACKSSPTKACI